MLFRKKEEKQSLKREEESTVPKSLRHKVSVVVQDHGKGLYRILARATPEGDENIVKKILAHNKAIEKPDATQEAGYKKRYAYEATPEEKIIAVHYPLIHTLLALAMAYHTGVHNVQSAKTVEEVMNALYNNRRDYAYIKENYKRLANAIAKQAHYDNLTTDPEKTAKVMERAFEKAFKIIDKLLPEVNEENLEVLGRALHMSTDDPFVVLRNAGIEVEPELEEFRQFLAEISGKKIEPKGSKARKAVEGRIPPEVLAIAKALEFSDFSEKAMKKAEKELLKMIDRFIEEEDAEALFHAVKLLRLVQKGDVGGIRKLQED